VFRQPFTEVTRNNRLGKFQHQKQVNCQPSYTRNSRETTKRQQHEQHVWSQFQIAHHLWWTVSFRLAEKEKLKSYILKRKCGWN